MGGRGSRRGGGYRSTVADTTSGVFGASGWTTRNFLVSTADANTDAIIAAPKTIAVVFRIDTHVAANRNLLSCRGSGTSGFVLQLGTTGRPLFAMHDGGGTQRNVFAAAGDLSVGDIHACVITCANVGGTGTIRARTDKAAAVVSASFTGYTAPTAGQKLALAAQNPGTSSPATGCTIFGVAVGDTVLSDAQIDAWLDDVASQQNVIPLSVGTSWARSFKGGMSDLCPRDLTGTGGLDLDLRATTAVWDAPKIERDIAPTWGWTFTDTGAYTPSGDTVPRNGLVTIDAIGPVASATTFQDNQHAAVGGIRCGAFLSGQTNDLATWNGGIPTDTEVICIFAGINGTDDGTEEPQEEIDYAALLEHAYSIAPNAHCIVSSLTPTSPQRAQATIFNAAQSAIWDASSYHAAGRLIRLDMFSALDPGTDLADGLHPNDAGYAKLAPVVLAGLQTACAGRRGRVRVVFVGDSITLGTNSTDSCGWRRIAADTYYPGPWDSAAYTP